MAKRFSDSPNRTARQLLSTLLKLIAEIYRAAPLAFVAVLLSVIIYDITPFLVSLILSLAIDELTLIVAGGVGVLTNTLALIMAAYAAVTILIRLNDTVYAYFEKKQYQQLAEYFTIKFLGKASELDLYHYEDSSKNDLIQRAKQSYDNRPTRTNMDLVWTISSLVALIASVGIVGSFSLPVLFLLVSTALPALWVNIKMSDVAYGIWDANSETRRRFYASSSHLQEERSLMELRIFRTKNYLFDMVKGIYLDFFGKEQQALRKQSVWDSVTGLISEIGLVVIAIIFVFAAINGEITVGLFTFYISAAGRFSSNLTSLFRKISRIREHTNYMYDYFEFMKLENKIKSGSLKISSKSPRIEFKNVEFSYPGADKPVFKNFNLVIQPGERIALVGKNGAGKTTMIKLLCRFYDVDGGQILIDGVDIRDYDLEDWYTQIGVLFQNFIQYNFLPVKQSIGVGDIKKIDSLEDIITSAKKSGADEFISNLKHKYDQVLSKQFPEGTDLSGGQWQRIALSRAFFRDAPILILDEPTSAIDPKGEEEIFEKLYEFTSGKTVLIISHRFSTVRQADKIYVIDNGEITEQGTHQELLALDGTYKQAFMAQAKGYQ